MCVCVCVCVCVCAGFPDSAVIKRSSANAGGEGSMPDLTRVSGVGNGNSVLLKNLFQYKLLKNLFQDKLLQDIEQSFPGCTVGSCH